MSSRATKNLNNPSSNDMDIYPKVFAILILIELIK
jgi:hypothetical protein